MAQPKQIAKAAKDAQAGAIIGTRAGAATPTSSQSVHWAGISERLPSGRQASANRTPLRRILPITGSARPSKGWRSRVTVTEPGKSRRWVVCRRFLRSHRSRGAARAPACVHHDDPTLAQSRRGRARRAGPDDCARFTLGQDWGTEPALTLAFSSWVSHGRRASTTVAYTIWPAIAG